MHLLGTVFIFFLIFTEADITVLTHTIDNRGDVTYC